MKQSMVPEFRGHLCFENLIVLYDTKLLLVYLFPRDAGYGTVLMGLLSSDTGRTCAIICNIGSKTTS